MADTEPTAPFAGVPKQVTYENTYITNPEGYGPVSNAQNPASAMQAICGKPAESCRGYCVEYHIQKVQGASSAQTDTEREDGISAV